VLFGVIIIAFGVLLANILAAAVGKGWRAVRYHVRCGALGRDHSGYSGRAELYGSGNNIIAWRSGSSSARWRLAVAIAFGIGGRDAAKKMLDRWTA